MPSTRPTCSKSAATQMSELVTYLNSNCKSQWSGRVWLDIEGSQYWLGSTSSNQAWYKVRRSSSFIGILVCSVTNVIVNKNLHLCCAAIERLLQDLRSNLRGLLFGLSVVRHLRKHLLHVRLGAALMVKADSAQR